MNGQNLTFLIMIRKLNQFLNEHLAQFYFLLKFLLMSYITLLCI